MDGQSSGRKPVDPVVGTGMVELLIVVEEPVADCKVGEAVTIKVVVDVNWEFDCALIIVRTLSSIIRSHDF